MKIFTSKSQKTGEVGENITCRYLESKGYSIVERNYTRKWGEIDIIAEKKGVIEFVEVKSVKQGGDGSEAVKNSIRPEENMTGDKIARLKRVTETYLMEKKMVDKSWKWNLVCVYLDIEGKKARVKMLEGIVL